MGYMRSVCVGTSDYFMDSSGSDFYALQGIRYISVIFLFYFFIKMHDPDVLNLKEEFATHSFLATFKKQNSQFVFHLFLLVSWTNK